MPVTFHFATNDARYASCLGVLDGNIRRIFELACVPFFDLSSQTKNCYFRLRRSDCHRVVFHPGPSLVRRG